eukprot:jgi/Tetstr1/461049/TSEL_006197.t1
MADGHTPQVASLGLRSGAPAVSAAKVAVNGGVDDKENAHPQRAACAPPASPAPGFGRPPPTPQSILKRRMALAAVPGDSMKKSGAKKQKRRVSFAPPAELETMHLYQVQEEESPAGEGESALSAPAAQASAPDSMSMDDNGSTMDLTECTSRMVSLGSGGFDVMNTVALPSLGQLAEDGEGDVPDSAPVSATPQRDLTGELPGLGELAEEDETLEGARKQLDLGFASDEEAPGAEREEGLTAQLNSLAIMISGDQQAAADGADGLFADTPIHTATMEVTGTSAGLRSIGAITPLTAPSERNDDVTDGGASSMRNTTDVDMDISSGATGRVPPGGTTARLADEMTMGYSKIWERGAHPAWGAEAVEEDSVAEEAEAPEDDEPVAQVPAVQAQRERWGIVPGQDDTLDIDLEVNARHLMGDVTWRHVYGTEAGTGEITRKIRLGYLMSDEEEEENPVPQNELEGLTDPEQDVDMDITGTSAADAGAEAVHVEENPAPTVTADQGPEAAAAEVEIKPQADAGVSDDVACAVVTPAPAAAPAPLAVINSGLKPPRPRRTSFAAPVAPAAEMTFSVAGTPTGCLDAGATTRLLIDDDLTPDAGDLGGFNTKTPSAFGFSDSMVPLSLSGGSRVNGNRTITCGATTALLAASSTGGTEPKPETAAAPSITPQAYVACEADGLVPLSLSGGSKADRPNEADRHPSQGELRLDSAFGVALDGANDSPLNGASSPTQRLADFGNIPTPSKPPPDLQPADLVSTDPQEDPKPLGRALPVSRAESLAELEGTFQALAGQLQSLKPKPDAAGKRERQPKHEALAAPALADPATVPGGPKLTRTPPQADQGAPEPAEPVSIPGGPKLARTPPGMQSEAPEVADEPTVIPWWAQAGENAAGRATPSGSLTTTAVPITFKSFLNLADVRFLDRLRRGTSGVGLLADGLARDPPPQDLAEAYKLMCLTTAELEEQESRLAILNAEVDSRKRGISAKEAQLDAANPEVFRRLQLAGEEEASAIKTSLAGLKAACRSRSVQRWKHWRVERELELGKQLQENHQILQQDVQFAAANSAMMGELLEAVRAHAATARADMAAEREASTAPENEPAAESKAAILERKAAAVRELDERAGGLEGRVEGLRRRLESLGRQREELVGRWKAAKDASSSPAPEVSARELLANDERLEIAQGLAGWRLEGATDTLSGLSSGEVVMRFSSLARFQMRLASDGVHGALELLPPSRSSTHPVEQLAVAARFACAGAGLPAPALPLPVESVDVGHAMGRWTWVTAAEAREFLQDLSAAMSRLQCFLQDLAALRLQVPALSGVALSPDGATVELRFMDLDAECLFTAALAVPPSYPAGPLELAPRVQLPGKHSLTPDAVLGVAAAVPEQFGRLQQLCNALGALASASPLST